MIKLWKHMTLFIQCLLLIWTQSCKVLLCIIQYLFFEPWYWNHAKISIAIFNNIVTLPKSTGNKYFLHYIMKVKFHDISRPHKPKKWCPDWNPTLIITKTQHGNVRWKIEDQFYKINIDIILYDRGTWMEGLKNSVGNGENRNC